MKFGWTARLLDFADTPAHRANIGTRHTQPPSVTFPTAFCTLRLDHSLHDRQGRREERRGGFVSGQWILSFLDVIVNENVDGSDTGMLADLEVYDVTVRTRRRRVRHGVYRSTKRWLC